MKLQFDIKRVKYQRNSDYSVRVTVAVVNKWGDISTSILHSPEGGKCMSFCVRKIPDKRRLCIKIQMITTAAKCLTV